MTFKDNSTGEIPIISLKIAGLTVNVKDGSELLLVRGKSYLTQSCENADIEIRINKEKVIKTQESSPDMSYDQCNYFLSGEEFSLKLLDYGGFILHASAVAVDKKAYLFSAGSGTGKSTHMSLWQQYLGEEKAVIINDDKPAIRLIDGRIYCCGTPWSGKSDKNVNISVPLKSIVFIEQSPVNEIRKIGTGQAVKLLLQNTIRPKDPQRFKTLLGLIDRILTEIFVYQMGCNMDLNAAKLSYQTLQEQ